jgi:uncharacterized protein YecT (DUF1311 family)
MKNSIAIFSILLITSFCSVALGQNKTDSNIIDKQLDACLDSSQNYTTYGMMQCEVRARDAWDKKLNKYYKLLMQTLSEDEKQKLKASQKNWLAFRDSENIFSSTIYNNMEGTMWGIAKIQSELELIKHRTLELKAYYSDKAPR